MIVLLKPPWGGNRHPNLEICTARCCLSWPSLAWLGLICPCLVSSGLWLELIRFDLACSVWPDLFDLAWPVRCGLACSVWLGLLCVVCLAWPVCSGLACSVCHGLLGLFRPFRSDLACSVWLVLLGLAWPGLFGLVWPGLFGLA